MRLRRDLPLLPFVGTALVTGGLFALCVPPLPLGPLVPLVLALALRLLEGRRSWSAFGWGYLAGLAWHAGSLHWIRHVLSVGPVAAIVAGLALLLAYLSLFPALWAWAWTRCRDRGLWWLWPFLFAGIELFRGWGQISFPWLHLAYDWGGHPALAQGVAWTGTIGLGFLMAFTAAWLVAGPMRLRSRIGLAIAFWGVWTALGAWRLAAPEPPGPRLRVAVVQPAVPQTAKWEESYFQDVLDRTFATASRLEGPVDLLAFPETALPDFWSWRPQETARFQTLADRRGATLVMGALETFPDLAAPRSARVFNSAFRLAPGGNPERYDKIRLVPFSERLPFDDVFPVLNFVDLGEGDFQPGDSIPLWSAGGIPWTPSICYEMVYADFARASLARGARVLVNLTNDGWFGASIGPWQHWNIQRFHALETGLPLVRAANTGISGAVDDRGRTLAASRLMADTLLVVDVPPGRGSFAGRHGGAIEAGLGGLALLAAAGLFLPGAGRRLRRVPPPV